MQPVRRYRTIGLGASAVLLFGHAGVLHAQIANGNFEGGFTGGVANGWTLFTTSGYSASGSDETANVHGGAHAQRINLPQPNSGEGYGGVFQVINTVPGQLYRIDFWIYAHMPNESYEGEDLEVHLGFDAQGRSSYDPSHFDFDVSWIGIDTDRDTWRSAGREFEAVGTQATLFFRGWRKYAQHGGGHLIIDDVTVQPVAVSHPPSHGSLPPPEAPSLTGSNLLANPDFENGFAGGVGNNWQSWTTRGTGTFTASRDLGKIGGGHYNPDGGGPFISLTETAKVAFAMPPCLDALVGLKQSHPELLTVGRLFIDEVNFWDLDDAGTRAAGQLHANNCYAEHLGKPGIDCWQGYNEPWVQSRERARKTCLFEQAFAERCTELGIRSCVLNLGVGNPASGEVAEFFRDVLAVADFVGYHAYGAAAEQFQTGPNQNDFSLRWRGIKSHYDGLGWRHPAVVYTEGGTYFGWKGTFSATRVRDEYIAFGPYMQADNWCLGETIFTVGGFGLWDEWDIADDPVIINGIRPWNQANSADARGGKAQEWYHNGSNFRGGIVQAVGTNAGNYWLSGWLKYETGPGGDPAGPAITFRIGYDPTGQIVSGNAGTIVWSSDQIASRYLNAYVWYELAIQVVATGAQTSIWFALDQPTPSPTGRVYVDALDLRAIDGTPPPLPRIELSPTSLISSAEIGTNAADQTFTVRNSGGGALGYSITDDVNWLYVTPSSGTSAGETDTITVHYTCASLSAGTYYGTIEVEAPGAVNTPQSISVTLTIGEPPPPGDFDSDRDVDQEDFGKLQRCYSGLGTHPAAGCEQADLDGDDDVDHDDFHVFEDCMSGPNVVADSNCAD